MLGGKGSAKARGGGMCGRLVWGLDLLPIRWGWSVAGLGAVGAGVGAPTGAGRNKTPDQGGGRELPGLVGLDSRTLG